ncbi:MAG: DNA repair protein RecN [Saprospiraceae bacterium]|nr:DNA repair protein RecN [Saprospiraceae bacterium]
MIKKIEIRNYALIDSLDIHFPKGLTIITGETGAGKSILLGALGLIMGKRADTKVLYNLEEKCVVEAVFDISSYDLRFFFEENDIDFDTELIVRREISPSGKSRAFINDTPTRLPVLQQLSAALIDLHRQFDALDIHQVSFQLRLLDALAGNKSLLSEYQGIYRQYQTDIRRLEDLKSTQRSANQETEFLQFQLKELEEAALQAGEQELLEADRDQLTNSEGIKLAVAQAYQAIIEDEQSLLSQLEQVSHQLEQVSPFHKGIEAISERIQGQIAELEDIGRELAGLSEDTEYDPERIQEVQERLDIIYRLLNKHHLKSADELLELQAELTSRLESFGDQDQQIDVLEKSIREKEIKLNALAAGLHEKRAAVIPAFEHKIHQRLGLLSMENAHLQVDLRNAENLTSTGRNEVHFLFAANKGDRLQEVKDVASGGELARLTLVTKSLVASSIPLPSLIFDEIDTGISGDVALKMGDILRELSDQHQVVAITHSPQVASKADAHYFVYKKDTTDRTVTRVKMLEEDERVRAIATMLSQNPPSESAMSNARELLLLK